MAVRGWGMERGRRRRLRSRCGGSIRVFAISWWEDRSKRVFFAVSGDRVFRLRITLIRCSIEAMMTYHYPVRLDDAIQYWSQEKLNPKSNGHKKVMSSYHTTASLPKPTHFTQKPTSSSSPSRVSPPPFLHTKSLTPTPTRGKTHPHSVPCPRTPSTSPSRPDCPPSPAPDADTGALAPGSWGPWRRRSGTCRRCRLGWRGSRSSRRRSRRGGGRRWFGRGLLGG